MDFWKILRANARSVHLNDSRRQWSRSVGRSTNESGEFDCERHTLSHRQSFGSFLIIVFSWQFILLTEIRSFSTGATWDEYRAPRKKANKQNAYTMRLMTGAKTFILYFSMSLARLQMTCRYVWVCAFVWRLNDSFADERCWKTKFRSIIENGGKLCVAYCVQSECSRGSSYVTLSVSVHGRYAIRCSVKEKFNKRDK